MKLPCAGCGRKVKVSFRIWWHYKLRGLYAWLHLQCWLDHLDQRRIDGI